MIVELVDKLIDRCIQLLKHKEEMSRRLWSDFVEPAYAEFEALHNSYLDTFKGYRDKLKNEKEPLPKLIDKIKEDNLFSENQRSKLRVLIQLSRDPMVGQFVDGIYEYLSNPYDFIPQADGLKWRKGQRWRTTLLGTLELIGDGPGATETAINRLDIIVEQMQDLHGLVTQRYFDLKKELLS